MKSYGVVGIGILFISLVGNTACAASFDCAKATTSIEKMICADGPLSKLDTQLGEVYTSALGRASDPAALRQEQRAWLKERNRCKDTACLIDQYQRRLDELQPPDFSATIYPEDISEFNIDCDNPKSSREGFICKEAYTYFRDMRNAFQWALMRGSDKQSLIESQRRWQKEVFDKCEDGYCLRQVALLPRTEELRALQARPDHCYTLQPVLDGNGYVEPIAPVCLLMEENLNRFCDAPPMVCELKIAPEFQKEITFPNWTPLDPEAHRDLIEEVLRTPWKAAGFPAGEEEVWSDIKSGLDAAFEAKTVTFSKGEIDLFNLGKSQLAYRLDYGACRDQNPQLASTQWEAPLRTAAIKIQHAPDVVRKLFSDYVPLMRSPSSEVFHFRGQTYSYWMAGYVTRGLEIENTLQIRQLGLWAHRGEKARNLSEFQICIFSYNALGGE